MARPFLVDLDDLDLVLSFEKRSGAPGAWGAYDRLLKALVVDRGAAPLGEATHARVRAFLAAAEEEMDGLRYGEVSVAECAEDLLDRVRVCVDAHEQATTLADRRGRHV